MREQNINIMHYKRHGFTTKSMMDLVVAQGEWTELKLMGCGCMVLSSLWCGHDVR